jgi:hypothetical protein
MRRHEAEELGFCFAVAKQLDRFNLWLMVVRKLVFRVICEPIASDRRGAKKNHFIPIHSVFCEGNLCRPKLQKSSKSQEHGKFSRTGSFGVGAPGPFGSVVGLGKRARGYRRKSASKMR